MLYINPQLQKDLVKYLNDINVFVKDIAFIPLGEESYGWKIETGNQTLFLKYCIQERILKNLSLILSIARVMSHHLVIKIVFLV